MSIPSDTQWPAGWYPDLDRPDQQDRWWDGSTWTSSIRAAARPEVVFPGAGGGGYPMPNSGGWQQPGVGGDGQPGVGPGAPVNSAATAGLTLGIIPYLAVPVASLLGRILGWTGLSVFISTFTLYIIAPSMVILGLIFSCVGLSKANTHRRAGFGPVGRSKAITGVVLSLLGLALLTTYVAWALYYTLGGGWQR